LRTATTARPRNAKLNASLQKLNGPVLGPADLANPLPELLRSSLASLLLVTLQR
jgi:hypothetical protein